MKAFGQRTNRTSSRAMSKSNMERALTRLEKELTEVVGAAPSLRGDEQRMYEDNLKQEIKTLLHNIRWLWG